MPLSSCGRTGEGDNDFRQRQLTRSRRQRIVKGEYFERKFFASYTINLSGELLITHLVH